MRTAAICIAIVLIWGIVSCDKKREPEETKTEQKTLGSEDLTTLIIPLIPAWKKATEHFTPSQVQLLWPPDGLTGAVQPLDLTWNPVSRSVAYQVQVAGEAGFAAPTIDLSTEKTVLYLKGSGGPLFWRVRAEGKGTEGPWSEVRSFSFGP
ncbi:MAG: hypothetical protein HY788_02870 [Deltaproteobacteria bacterium]|nr:hypothetical protein [Deltaproteobacteria bacterium]